MTQLILAAMEVGQAMRSRASTRLAAWRLNRATLTRLAQLEPLEAASPSQRLAVLCPAGTMLIICVIMLHLDAETILQRQTNVIFMLFIFLLAKLENLCK